MKAALHIQNIETYYFASKLEEVRQLQLAGKDIINLGIGSPDIEPRTEIINRLEESAREKGSSQYQAYKGLPELRQAFSTWYDRVYQVKLNPETELLPLMGSKEAIMHIHLAFCNPGDTVLIPNPGYPTYAASAKMLGLRVAYYDLSEDNEWMPNFDLLPAELLKSAKVMWINYPNMPTGKQACSDALKKIIRVAQENELLLINDNPYSLIRNERPRSIHAIETDYTDIIELNSLSKSHNLSGWRVGVASGSAENISHMVKVKSNFDSGMYKPIQLAAISALELDDTWTNDLNAIYSKRAEIVWKIAEQLGLKVDKSQVGLFVWAKVPSSVKNGDELSDQLLYDFDIFATPGKIFGSNGDQYIRFSLCATEERLQEALNRLIQKK